MNSRRKPGNHEATPTPENPCICRGCRRRTGNIRTSCHCRRSWVRIPSAALEKAHVCRSFWLRSRMVRLRRWTLIGHSGRVKFPQHSEKALVCRRFRVLRTLERLRVFRRSRVDEGRTPSAGLGLSCGLGECRRRRRPAVSRWSLSSAPGGAACAMGPHIAVRPRGSPPARERAIASWPKQWSAQDLHTALTPA
jgi:hypothetical protein